MSDPSHRIQARAPRTPLSRPRWLTRPDETISFLEDAAHTPGGRAAAVALPETEGEVAWVLRECAAVLPVGAQSSLTGGATPAGEVVLSLSRMAEVGAPERDRVRVGPGTVLEVLEGALAPHGLCYPPTSTYRGASLGGTTATNAAGASTFKHGTTRRWVRALTVVLAGGDVLDVQRGACLAHPDGFFEIVRSDGRITRVAVPGYRMPAVPKCSAGYFSEPGMDLVDLFVGSEGTLGVVTSVELRLIPARPVVWGFMTFDEEPAALTFVAALRAAARTTWAERDPTGIDVAAIESFDHRSLSLLREDGADRAQQTKLPPSIEAALLFQLELPEGSDAAQALSAIEGAAEGGGPDSALGRLVRLVEAHADLERLEVVLPGETRRVAQLLALREAVPEAVNRRIAAAQRSHGPAVRKTAGDMIVPFDSMPEKLRRDREALTRRGLDHAIWGHVSDGNLHVNVIPAGPEDTRAGEEALLEMAAVAIELGGSPLAEHGVGRHPIKQALMRRLYGEEGAAAMRRVKAALDPEWRLAPGVLFPREG